MEFAIIVGIIVTVLSLLAYEDYLWKEEIRLRQEESKRQEAERSKVKKDPVGDLVASILLAGLAQGLEAYAKDCAVNK